MRISAKAFTCDSRNDKVFLVSKWQCGYLVGGNLFVFFVKRQQSYSSIVLFSSIALISDSQLLVCVRSVLQDALAIVQTLQALAWLHATSPPISTNENNNNNNAGSSALSSRAPKAGVNWDDAESLAQRAG